MTNVMAEGLASAGGTRWYDLRDEASGAVRRVFVWLPPGDAPQAGWPALMMTDGNAVIGMGGDGGAVKGLGAVDPETIFKQGQLGPHDA